MPPRTISLRELNRATLARQGLVARSNEPVAQMVERLVGLQAQAAAAPFVGLWTRLNGFQHDDLARRIDERVVVKATMMRATLHLVTAADYPTLRATLQPVLESASAAIARQRGVEIDRERLLRLARDFIAEAPRSFAEISAMLSEAMPGVDVGPLRYTVRTYLPLVQVPNDSTWCYPGNPKFTLADDWLNQPVTAEADLPALVSRYLAAFGPARVTDIQTWSGFGKLKSLIEPLRDRLVSYRDEQSVELLDLPEQPLPDGDIPAPERFLPAFDNLLLAYSNRNRIVADAFRSRVFLPGLRVAATFLVDGFVAGTWTVEKAKGGATLVIAPFGSLSGANRAALEEEGERLVRFVEPDAKNHALRFVSE